MSLAVLADHMASKGRGPDSMLIHMSPREVQGLQALAMKHGGSLTINPETGLPEAGFLDKLLPTIIGFGISYFSGGTIDPKTAAMIVGGVETARTGDIGKGISAGLGAYGGAGIGAGMTAAGTEAIGSQAAGQSYLSSYAPPGVLEGAGAGLSADMAYNLSQAGIDTAGTQAANVAQQAAAERIATATPFEKLTAGAEKVAANPMGYATKDNVKNLMYAAGPAILAGANVQSKGPQTITKPGMIRPYSFDPYGGTYTAGTPYEAMPTRSAGGGLMGMAAGGIAGYGDGDDVPRQNGMAQGGMYDFAQRSEPVVRMAEGGGIVALAGGGDYTTLTKDSSAEDIASAYKQFTTASGGDTAANQQAAIDYLTNLGIGQDTIGQAYGTYQASPTYTAYTDAQMGSFLSNPANKDINLDKAIIDTNANPADVNRYIASLASPFVGSTDTTGGSGTLGIYNNMVNQYISPDEYYDAVIRHDPKYAGWSKEDITRGYNLDKGAYALSKELGGNVSDKDWVKFMDDNNYSINDAAQAFGLSRNEVQRRYDAVKAAEKKVVTPITTVTGTGGTNVIGTGGIGAGTGVSLGTATNLPPGVSGGGNTYVNANGTITTRPDFSLQMKDVRDTYEKGGGSLGVNKNLFVPKTQDELFARYKNTGGSKAALDYLMGKTPYSPTPYTPTGEIQKPYWESVGRFPENRSTKKYVFVDGKYQLNPDYVKPSYVLAGEKAAALTNQDKEPTESPGAGNKWTWNSTDKKWEATPISAVADTTQTDPSPAKEGGLMAMARGGMSQQFNLGDYSDGGRLLRGPGDGVSDSIPASIGGKRPARLADGEFVVPARIVSELGNGSTEAGARKLYAMMDRIQKARRGTVGKGKVAKNSRSDKYLPA